MKQLSGVDANFLNMETRTTFGHVSSLGVFDRPDDPTFDPYQATRSQIESRLAVLEPFRRRLVHVPLGLDHPYWIADPDFDLDFHIRHIAAPPPGEIYQLTELVSRIIGRPMDRGRPLWECYVIDGLQDNQFALLTKVHHATIDGAAGAELLAMLLDHEPDSELPDSSSDPWQSEREPTGIELLGRTALSMTTKPADAARLLSHAIGAARKVASKRGIGGLGEMAGASPEGALSRWLPAKPNENDPDIAPVLPTISAPPTPWNRSITPHRRFAVRSVSLTDVKALKRDLGCTVNDVIMAMVAGGLRRWLEEHDALPNDPLVSMVPVSVRTGDEEDKWTNRVSALFVTIPTDKELPLDRLASIHQTMNEAKATFDLLPADVLTELADFAPPALATRAARLAHRLHIGDRMNAPINVVISNVPGPRIPLYLRGATLQHYYPVSAIIEGAGLNVTVQSYLDTLDFGLVACRELVPDLDDMVEMIADEMRVLREQADEVLA